jgi:hypothetical protein
VEAASVRPSSKQPAIVDEERVNVNVDVWNSPGHALDALAYVRVEKERNIYKLRAAAADSGTQLRLKALPGE